MDFDAQLEGFRQRHSLQTTNTQESSTQNKLSSINSSDEKEVILYVSDDGNVNVSVYYYDETFWLTQKAMAELFECSTDNISLHLKNIYSENELDEFLTTEIFSVVQTEGSRNVKRSLKYYNLDAIIAVGYRVNSMKATKFRQWATTILREFIIKGFVLNDDMLKNGKKFGKDYFDELLERIREIRASERRFYQKITDIYAQCSYDYDRKSSITRNFFANVQNKLLFAVTNHTAPEIINQRADSSKEHMGLTSWKNGPDGKILKSDVLVSKNYLNQDELSSLNGIVNMYLDYAENQAKRGKLMSMQDWVSRLDSFLDFNEYDILDNLGSISRKVADELAIKEYEKYRIIQDQNYTSDFDKMTEKYLK